MEIIIGVVAGFAAGFFLYFVFGWIRDFIRYIFNWQPDYQLPSRRVEPEEQALYLSHENQRKLSKIERAMKP